MERELLINIPKEYEIRLYNLGDEGKIWQGKIFQFIENIQNYLSQSPYFFPEYTKHTIEHVNNTLKISIKLISRETLQELNADAIGVLIMGIISHDVGMFVKPDGLAVLLKKKMPLGETTWYEMWEGYQSQLRHYSDNDIKKCFGDPNNFDLGDGLDIMELPHDLLAGRLSQWRIRLCGEFLRKMHPRLAQEIIENGFPGIETFDLFSNIEIDTEYRKLVGILAKSHGMDMADLAEELRLFDEETPEYPYEVPIYYLMSILRLADYFDAGKDRAPHAIMAMQRFESEISYDEFKWNQIIRLGNDWGEKNFERVFVHVKLEDINSKTFLKVESWLTSLQRELDICWRQMSLYYKDQYKLSIRRINSNIFQKSTRKELESKVVIEKAKLQAASSILRLLIAPLYGNSITYGVRELLQNSLDACRERKAIESKKENLGYSGKVWIEVNSECRHPHFTITDNGCGMTKEVILKYFLVAGSSYRDNPKWKQQFENQNIKRSGRFGIGVLAAFLLGDKITVETKHIDENASYCFEINNCNYEQINICRKEEIDKDYIRESGAGTSIRIELSRDIAKRMVNTFRKGEVTYMGAAPDWAQWYWLPSPQVQYIVNGKTWDNPYAQKNDKDLCGLQENTRWFALEEKDGYDEVWWTPEKRNKFWCNGLNIPKCPKICIGEYDEYLKYDENFIYDFYLTAPSVSVMDSKNITDLDLARDKLQSVPKKIQRALYLENCKLALSFLMMIDFSQQKEVTPEFPFGIKIREAHLSSLLFNKKGYNLPVKSVLKAISSQMIWVLYKDGRWSDISFDKLDGVVSLLHYGDHVDMDEDDRDGLFNSFFFGYERGLYLKAVQVKKKYAHSFCDASPLEKLNGKKAFAKKMEEIAELIYEEEFYEDEGNIEDLYDFKEGKFFPYAVEIKSPKDVYISVATEEQEADAHFLMELRNYYDVACGYRVLKDCNESETEVDKLMERYLKDHIWIPYDIQERKKLFPEFFDPKNEIYKYVEYVGKQEGFYDVKQVRID